MSTLSMLFPKCRHASSTYSCVRANKTAERCYHLRCIANIILTGSTACTGEVKRPRADRGGGLRKQAELT